MLVLHKRQVKSYYCHNIVTYEDLVKCAQVDMDEAAPRDDLDDSLLAINDAILEMEDVVSSSQDGEQVTTIQNPLDLVT